MFDHTSRYFNIETVTLTPVGGQPVSHLRRRFLPQGGELPPLAQIAVQPGDRLDLIANRTLGDPLAFWRICDANNAMDPLKMLEDAAGDPARRLMVPMPTV